MQSPLSMVRDKKPNSTRRRIKRRSSWKDALRDLASGGEGGSGHSKTSSSSSKGPSKILTHDPLSTNGVGDEGVLADAESEDEDDFRQYREEDRPIQARVLYKYPYGGANVPRSESALERRQQELSIAIEEANTKATLAMAGKMPHSSNGTAKEPIGTRLTMTSRTGYFQDRIVSPSMVGQSVSRWTIELIVDRCGLWQSFILDHIGILILLLTIISLPSLPQHGCWHNFRRF